MNFSHVSGLFNPDHAKPVVVYGAGSVGGLAVFALAKMGVHDITVCDGDAVESHNVPSSIYRPRDIGRYKVRVLQEIVRDFTDIEIKIEQRMYGGERLKNAAVVSCVDTMAARALLWSRIRDRVSIPLFCDTRTHQAYVEVYSTRPAYREDAERYDSTLFPDEEALKNFCGLHGAVNVSMYAAQVVATMLTRFWTTGEVIPLVRERVDLQYRVAV